MKKIVCAVLAFVFVFSSALCVFAENGLSQNVQYPTPTNQDSTALKWAVRFGTSYRDAPSIPSVTPYGLAVMSGKKLIKVSTEDGSVLSDAEMSTSPGYACIAPTYADGIVFCPLIDGVIEAFDFVTMTKLWTYTDDLGGQAINPVTYSNGYVYTGFWNNDDETASYICLDAVTGEKIWSIDKNGGFYWAGCAVVGDYVVFGSDDGTVYDNREADVCCVNAVSGEISDTMKAVGDVRSTVVYDSETGRIYFVTKGGYLYSAVVENGKFTDVKSISLGGASTSAPSIFGGRLYVGVQTGSMKGNISVIDAESLDIVYSADTPGYPQNKFLISSGYGDTIYIYSTYNAMPGGLLVMLDSVGQTEPVVSEIFTPSQGQTGFCISSVAADTDGTLYYKNDSGYIFALKNNIDFNAFFAFLESFFAKIQSMINIFKELFV